MKKVFTTAAASLLMMSATFAQVNWKVDASHSKLGFSVTHMMVSETEGKFKVFDGTASSKTEMDFTDAKIGAGEGSIALQIHDGGGIKVRWKNITLEEL